MHTIKSVCVFCGSRNQIGEKYLSMGKAFGERIAKNGLDLVYGGANCGMMGAVADGAIENGGRVTGVYPRVLEGLEDPHPDLHETIIVDDMHTRKMKMFNRADAFFILPGGFGTMDETFEVITWRQLDTHIKPIVLYNFENYYEHWKILTDHFIEMGSAGETTAKLYQVVDSMDDAFKAIGY